MPLFGSKFSPKKIPNRRSRSLSNLSLDSNQAKEEFGIECGPARLNLGGSEMTFEDGHWVPASGFGAASHQELVILRKKNEQLLNENNFLKVKCETLLDMLTETTVNSHLQIKEISQLKKMVRTKNS
ncbi:protein chibby homolog 1-like [Argonauta hians]